MNNFEGALKFALGNPFQTLLFASTKCLNKLFSKSLFGESFGILSLFKRSKPAPGAGANPDGQGSQFNKLI